MKLLLGILSITFATLLLLAVISADLAGHSRGASARDCSPARPHDEGRTDATIRSGGIERHYVLYVPEAYSGRSPVPLVLNFHGLDSNAWQQLAYTGFAAEANEENFILVLPQGTGATPSWNVADAPGRPDDVAFVDDLLTQLESRLCVDPDRVFAAGMSNGGLMSSRLACELGDRIAAVATVAGILPPDNCSTQRPVPVIAFHGKADELVPYAGGQVMGGGFVGASAPVEDTIAKWAKYNGCTRHLNESGVGENIQLFQYADCISDATVELYAIDNGGHTWPGASGRPAFGLTSDDIIANKLIWNFFADHPLSSSTTS